MKPPDGAADRRTDRRRQSDPSARATPPRHRPVRAAGRIVSSTKSLGAISTVRRSPPSSPPPWLRTRSWCRDRSSPAADPDADARSDPQRRRGVSPGGFDGTAPHLGCLNAPPGSPAISAARRDHGCNEAGRTPPATDARSTTLVRLRYGVTDTITPPGSAPHNRMCTEFHWGHPPQRTRPSNGIPLLA